jgi:hypothetical protein
MVFLLLTSASSDSAAIEVDVFTDVVLLGGGGGGDGSFFCCVGQW